MDNKNLCFSYKLSGKEITRSEFEKFWSVYFAMKLNFVQHTRSIYDKASVISNVIYSTFVYKDNAIKILLYKTYVKPIVEYTGAILTPHYLYLIDAMENAQNNFTKKIV